MIQTICGVVGGKLREDLSAGRLFQDKKKPSFRKGDKIQNCGGGQKQYKQHGNSENGYADREQTGICIGLM